MEENLYEFDYMIINVESCLNGSLNNDINALNPSDSIKAYIKCYPGGNGEGWYRFSEIIFNNTNVAVLKKVRAVRKDNIIFLDIYSSQISNDTYVLLNIPFGARITSAQCIKPYLVPETADGEVIVCSVDLADNI